MSSEDAARPAVKREREPERAPEDGADAAGRRVAPRAVASLADYYYLLSDDDPARWRALSVMVRTIGKARAEEALVAMLTGYAFHAAPRRMRESGQETYAPTTNPSENCREIQRRVSSQAWEHHGLCLTKMAKDLHVLRAYLPL